MADNIRATPQNPYTGALARGLRSLQQLAGQYQVDPRIPLLGGTSVDELLSLPGAASLAEDVSYYGPRALIRGGNVATGGIGTFRLDPRVADVADVAMNVTPLAAMAGKTATRGAMAAGRAGERLAERVVPQVMERGGIGAQLMQDMVTGSRSQVVKPKGGNWLAGSVERSIEPMKTRVIGQDPASRLRDLDAAYAQNVEAGVAMDPAVFARERARLEPEVAMNRWLETKLGKYMRNEMATPEDPIRALAEKGVLHTEVAPTSYYLKGPRAQAGFPEEGMGVSPLAKAWEDKSDTFINELRASDITQGYPGEIEKNPWLLKVPPETRVYDMLRGADEDLGFSHLADELRNAINHESGLPENLRWKYSDLDKVTVPQAVERVAKINDWRAAQKAEADMARAMNPATQVVKEYPEQGFKWVELRAPKETGRKIIVEKPEMDLPPGMDQQEMRDAAMDMAFDEGLDEGTQAFDDFVQNLMTDFNRKKKVEMDESYKALEDALKYEGETMGHCVGGYCPDVVEGRSKIYSLRDKKGQPHVTIEVKPWRSSQGESLAEFEARLRSDPMRSEQAIQDIMSTPQYRDEIVQIKGKANKAPKEEYLPAVQDFVRSGNFGKIGDLKNAGLVQLPDKRLITNEQFDEAISRISDGGDRPTNEWFMNVMRNDPSWWEEMKGAFEGFAQGGQVRGYAEGGAVSAGEADASPFDAYKFANRQSVAGNDMSVMGFGAGADVGGGRLDAALEMMRMERAQDAIPQDVQNRTARVSYSKQLGDLGLNATALKPLDVEGVYLGMLNGSIPLGLGRLLLGIQGEKTPWHTGVTGHSIGYSGRVGPGSLNANVQRSRSGDVRGNVEYRLPFAEGGAVSGANFPTDDFDPARIDAIVGELHALNAG